MNLGLYRKFINLNNQARVLLRPLLKEDYENFSNLYNKASDEDVAFLRHNVRDPEIIKKWIENIDLNTVFPMLAIHNEKIVGNATLHFGKHSHRHSAQLRIYIAPDYRRLGLGTLMIKELLDISHKIGLKIVWAEIVIEQSKVIKAFLELGFQFSCVLRDWFMSQSGKCYDVALLIFNLGKKSEPDF